MDYVLLTLRGVYRVASSLAAMQTSRSLNRLGLVDEQNRPTERAHIKVLPPHDNYPRTDVPEFYPLPLLPLPAPSIDAPGPTYDLSQAFLEHLLNPTSYDSYVSALARLWEGTEWEQLATVANHPPITSEQALAQLSKPLPTFTVTPVSTAPSWCGPLENNKQIRLQRFGAMPVQGCWVRYDIATVGNNIRRVYNVHMPWFDFAPEIPLAARIAAYAMFIESTDEEVIAEVWAAKESPEHRKRAADIVRQLAWSDFIQMLPPTDDQPTWLAVQLGKQRRKPLPGWPAEYLHMGLPFDGGQAVMTPFAYRELQSFHRQADDARARREEARLLHLSAPTAPDRRGGRGRGRPPGAPNNRDWPELRKALLREQHPPFQPNVLQLMKIQGQLPFDWSSMLDFVNPTRNFTRCSPLLPGLCPALPRTALNLMHPESLLWRNLLLRMQGTGCIRMGQEAFNAFYERHPAVFDMAPLEQLPGNVEPYNGYQWRAATLYVPLPLNALSLLTMPCDEGLLHTAMPDNPHAMNNFDAYADVRGYYDNDALAIGWKTDGWRVPANQVMGFRFDR